MEQPAEKRSDRKRRLILEAASTVFLDRGYNGTTMDEVATLAGVSKPTLYRHFTDKERLYAAIIQLTADDVDKVIQLVAGSLADASHPREALQGLARKLVTALMQPELLRLRRLVIANAERFPEVARAWFAQGFERVLATLAASFERYAQRGLLKVDDPLLAANHFTGLLLWIPLNRAMFTGDHASDPAELERYANAAVDAFLSGYASR
ncbi:MAG: TetR/AcrR family transcriptional regulator [Pseudomonadota bacterium]